MSNNIVIQTNCNDPSLIDSLKEIKEFQELLTIAPEGTRIIIEVRTKEGKVRKPVTKKEVKEKENVDFHGDYETKYQKLPPEERYDPFKDWQDYLIDIELALESGSFDWASETLLGIAEWIEDNEHITSAQKRAINNILDSGYD